MLLKVRNNLTSQVNYWYRMLNCARKDLRLAKMILKSANLSKQFPSIQTDNHCYSFHKYLPTKTFQYRINKDISHSLIIVPGILGILYILFWLCSYNDLLQESRQHQHWPWSHRGWTLANVYSIQIKCFLQFLDNHHWGKLGQTSIQSQKHF